MFLSWTINSNSTFVSSFSARIKMSGNVGKRFRTQLPGKPAEVTSPNAFREDESPGDTDYVRDDSASSDDSISVLSQSLCKRRLVPSLKRENARQNFAECPQSNPDKDVSGQSLMFFFLSFTLNIGFRCTNINLTFFPFSSQSGPLPT